MNLYDISKDGKISIIKENPFKLEKDIQSFIESNLNSLLRLQFVKSEFALQNFRIDSLAFDPDSKSFVIIEYKRDKNFSVIDQGYAYLSLMLNNKADFILEYNESSSSALQRKDVDWSQSKVIFISPSFTNYQREAINFRDLPIELWEIKRYSNNTVALNQIQTTGAQETIKTISGNDDAVKSVSKEIKVYTEQDHLENASDATEELYTKFKTAILNLDDLKLKPNKYYIGFLGNSNVVDIHIQKKAIKIWINLRKGELDDPKEITRDVSSIGHWGNGDYEIHINDDENFEYILSLIRQSLKKNKK